MKESVEWGLRESEEGGDLVGWVGKGWGDLVGCIRSTKRVECSMHGDESGLVCKRSAS